MRIATKFFKSNILLSHSKKERYPYYFIKFAIIFKERYACACLIYSIVLFVSRAENTHHFFLFLNLLMKD